MKSQARILTWIALALLLGRAGPAAAQGSAAAPRADASAPSVQGLYAAAQKLFDKGNYSDALVAFRQAYIGSNSPNARLMVGQCLLALGKAAEAYEEMSATLTEAEKRAETEPKYAPTRDAARAQVALLEPRVGKIVIVLPDRTAADVLVNGSRLHRDRLGIAIAVDPGTVVVSATRADGRAVQQEVSVPAGKTEKITLTFPEAPARVGGAATAAPTSTTAAPIAPVTPPPSGLGTLRAAGIAVAGAGAAGMVVFAVTGSLARDRFQTLETECGGQRCTEAPYAGVVDEGRALSAASTAGLVTGIAGLLGGGLMIALGGPATTVSPTPARAGARRPANPAIVLSPAGAGLRCTGTF